MYHVSSSLTGSAPPPTDLDLAPWLKCPGHLSLLFIFLFLFSCLGAELGSEELADLSRVALKGQRQVHHVEDDGLDAVTPALHFADDTGHLVPVRRVDRSIGRVHQSMGKREGRA